ncbi:GDSL esterase/lipase 7-like protein [Tanacetum coccineum]|uniref:GDSL esterase/lipase 7-like protein n=1 Tax=Tanacetum coccineum TaxID=301880 RepID=A0ABQ5E9F6_9ASTR
MDAFTLRIMTILILLFAMSFKFNSITAFAWYPPIQSPVYSPSSAPSPSPSPSPSPPSPTPYPHPQTPSLPPLTPPPISPPSPPPTSPTKPSPPPLATPSPSLLVSRPPLSSDSPNLPPNLSPEPEYSAPSPAPSLPLNNRSLSDAQVPGSPVRALFVIGDSTVDSGTNNFLGTFARADHAPYGRDFDTHKPTGRFSNGRVPVDYLGVVIEGPLKIGANYASAAAGIIFSSGSKLGQHISFTQQIQQITDTFQWFIIRMGKEEAASYISNSIIYISIGSNDYIHYYLRNVSAVQTKYVSLEFNQLLVYLIRQEIKNLYNANVRRMVVMGLGPIGCAPFYLWQYGSENEACIKMLNNMILEFNSLMRFTIEELLEELTDANIIFCDAFQGSMDILKNSHRYGIGIILSYFEI